MLNLTAAARPYFSLLRRRRAAYADALLTAVRQNRGPALTSGFALNKRQFKQRLAALWDTAPKHRGRALLAVLALAALCAFDAAAG